MSARAILDALCAEREQLRETLADREAEAQATATELAKATEGLRRHNEALRELQAQLDIEQEWALAREEALDEARGLFDRALSALLANDLAEEAHALARQASWLEVRETTVVLSEEAEP